ncbi:hypothetical protein [Ralstonia pseudosolanacearum]
MPPQDNAEVGAHIVKLSVEQLHWLLDGIDIAVVKKHPQRFYACAS